MTVRGEGELTLQVGESIPEVRDSDARNFDRYPLKPIMLTDVNERIALPGRALRFARLALQAMQRFAMCPLMPAGGLRNKKATSNQAMTT